MIIADLCTDNAISKINLPHIIITLLANFFALIGFAIYLEIIILKFCGLNEDIRINIIDRGIVDSTHTFIEDSD